VQLRRHLQNRRLALTPLLRKRVQIPSVQSKMASSITVYVAGKKDGPTMIWCGKCNKRCIHPV
jgi:hypothetical protein